MKKEGKNFCPAQASPLVSLISRSALGCRPKALARSKKSGKLRYSSEALFAMDQVYFSSLASLRR